MLSFILFNVIFRKLKVRVYYSEFLNKLYTCYILYLLYSLVRHSETIFWSTKIVHKFHDEIED